nr:hypothetical protein PanWU01x14_211300 [Ipomoea batatas]
MVNKLRFGHSKCIRHPIQKLHVRSPIQIDKPLNIRPRVSRAISQPLEIPFREIDSIINWLKAYNRECNKENKRMPSSTLSSKQREIQPNLSEKLKKRMVPTIYYGLAISKGEKEDEERVFSQLRRVQKNMGAVPF